MTLVKNGGKELTYSVCVGGVKRNIKLLTLLKVIKVNYSWINLIVHKILIIILVS